MGFHAVPALVLTADLLLCSPPWEVGLGWELGLSVGLAFGYWGWVERCFGRNGFYPYPIFEMVGFGGRVGLFALSAVVMTGSTEGLKWLYGVVNGVDRRTEGTRGVAMDESTIQEQVEAYVKEGTYIAKGQMGN